MRLFLRPTVPRVCATAVCPPSLRVHYDAFTGAPPPAVPPHYSLLTTYMSAVSNGLLPFTSADDPFVCFTGALAAVLILRIGLPDSAKPYGYMRLFLRPTVPRVCATAVCPGVRSSQNAPSLDPLSYPSDHYLRLRSIRRAVPFSVTLRLHCIFRRLPCACAYTPAWSPEARAGRTRAGTVLRLTAVQQKATEH